jgi:hypothetical protein
MPIKLFRVLIGNPPPPEIQFRYKRITAAL